jgi:GH15 family glucan-1,4-alpha-glucosidase
MSGRIEDLALIGDTHTAALVERDGAVSWLCLPRFDAPACFASLLGDEDDGQWRVSPVSAVVDVRRGYRPGTLVLETVMETDSGVVRLTDFMPRRRGTCMLVRIVEGLSGEVSMREHTVSAVRLRAFCALDQDHGTGSARRPRCPSGDP